MQQAELSSTFGASVETEFLPICKPAHDNHQHKTLQMHSGHKGSTQWEMGCRHSFPCKTKKRKCKQITIQFFNHVNTWYLTEYGTDGNKPLHLPFKFWHGTKQSLNMFRIAVFHKNLPENFNCNFSKTWFRRKCFRHFLANITQNKYQE